MHMYYMKMEWQGADNLRNSGISLHGQIYNRGLRTGLDKNDWSFRFRHYLFKIYRLMDEYAMWCDYTSANIIYYQKLWLVYRPNPFASLDINNGGVLGSDVLG